MRFGLVSCQDFQNGFFSAYANLAAEDLDFVVHAGDYIYEDGARAGAPRQVVGGEIQTIADYRIRHAQYRLDPALQAVHAAFPFIVTFDDHEVENNYAGAISEDNIAPTLFLARRAAPTRRTSSTCRFVIARGRREARCGCIGASSSDGSRPSTCSTPGSTAPISRAATV